MKEESLDLLRKYIDLQIALEIKCEQAATEDYYDESIPWTRREIEEAWKAFTDALGRPPVRKENENERLIEILIDLAEIVEALSDIPDSTCGYHAYNVLERLKALKEKKGGTG